jgi:hypothetical protein
MPEYRPSPLDESRHRYDQDAAAVTKHANKVYLIGAAILVLIAAIVILVLVLK